MTKTNSPADISFFSFAALAPVHKPKTHHYSDTGSALIAGLIEDTLNPTKSREGLKSRSILVLKSL